MKVSDILKSIGKTALTAIGVANPLVGAGIAAVNMFLPDDKKLPESATGQEVQDAAASLPPDQRASLLEKRVDLEIAREEGWTERYKAMCENDGQSSRARIALMMARTTCFIIILFSSAITVEIINHGLGGLSESQTLWTIFGVLTTVPAGLLGKYFGELRREQTNRQAVISGQTLTSGVGAIFKRK